MLFNHQHWGKFKRDNNAMLVFDLSSPMIVLIVKYEWDIQGTSIYPTISRRYEK